MIWFIFGLILLLVAAGCVIGAVADSADRVGWAAGAAGAILIGLLLVIVSCVREVPVKNVGVMTSFGKVEGFMTPGIHMTAPWKTVVLLPETVQTTTFEGGFGKGGACAGLDVRIGGQQQGCLDATIQWQVKDSAAAELFNLYNTGGSVLDDITNAVVVREFKVAVNQVMGDYNPIQDVALNSGAGNSQFSTFGPLIETAMKKDIGAEINVRSVLVPFLHYDAATQARLNAIQQQYGATAIAEEQIKTNQALANANKAIGAVTPAELVQECLGIVQDAEKTGYPLPAGFGNCISGSSIPVTVSAKK